MADRETPRRPGGRSARVRAAVHRAAAELVAERGYGSFTMGDIAARADVADSSLYRRWGTLESLITDVVITWLTTHSPIPDTGTLDGDLRAYAAGVARDINGPDGLAALRLMIALSNAGEPGSAARDQFLAERRRQLQQMLDRAQARGERRVEALDILDHILAPLYIRTLFGMGPITQEYADTLVNAVLAPSQPDGPARKPGRNAETTASPGRNAETNRKESPER